MQKIRLGVFFGGPSVEHEIAVISAAQAMAAADPAKYELVPVYISKDGLWYTGPQLLDMKNYADLPKLLSQCQQVHMLADRGAHKLVAKGRGLFAKTQELPLDVVLPVMHGAHGEDGCLQGFLELLNIPYAGPGVLAAAVGMDKIMMKNVLAANQLPVLPGLWFTADEWFAEREAKLQQVEEQLGWPVIVKPANLGSSVGISRADNQEELAAALDEAANFSGRLLLEPCLTDYREINCSVLGYGPKIRASVCEEPLTSNDFLTYQDKYLGGSGGAKGGKMGAKSGVKAGVGSKAGSQAGAGMSSAQRRVPADLSSEQAAEIQSLASRAFTALDGCGVARVDLLLDKTSGHSYINEVNTIPGSLSFYLWQASGLDFTALIDELVESALWRQRSKAKLTYSYDTNILAGLAASANGPVGTKAGAKGGLK